VGPAFYSDYGDVNDAKTKALIMRDRYSQMASAEARYFEDWGGPGYLENLQQVRKQFPVKLSIDRNAFARDHPQFTPREPAAAAPQPQAQPAEPPVTRDCQPRIHHDSVEWRWPPEDSTPLYHAAEPEGQVLPPLPPPRMTVSVMRVGHPPAVRVRVPRDASLDEFKHEISERLFLNGDFTISDQSGSIIVAPDDLMDGELLFIEDGAVDPFRKDARARQSPSPWASGIRRSDPAYYAPAPAQPIAHLSPFQRRRMHEQRFVESKAVAKEQFLTAGLGADQLYRRGVQY